MENIIFERIKQEVESNDIVLFMKGSSAFPQCGFSAAVVQILAQTGVEYKDIDVLQDADLRQGIKDFANWPTIPQLYLKGEFVGGCDIVRDMFENNELQQMLDEKGITASSAA